MFDKLEELLIKYEDVTNLISDPEIISNQNKFQKYAKEHGDMRPVVEKYLEYKETKANFDEALEILKETSDDELKELALMEIDEGKVALKQFETDLQLLLLPKDPYDNKNIFLEIRAGTGGDEASLFCAALLRMYSRYAEGLKWKIEVVDFSETNVGGFKEVVLLVKGKGAYSRLKYEAGGHRVQRIPETESGGRVHTSACTVAVLPEADDVSDVKIEPKDLRVDVYRASGSGGQHVNTTDSAVRITHLPSGVVVACQDERSQIKNKDKAMKHLRSKLLEMQIREQQAEIAQDRKLQVGSGDRSERIRTYNYPQNRITDHRINLTLYSLDKAMEGEIGEILDAIVAYDQAEKLKEAGI